MRASSGDPPHETPQAPHPTKPRKLGFAGTPGPFRGDPVVSTSQGERHLGWALIFDGMVFEADVLQAVLETRGLVVQRRGGDEGFSLPGVSRTRLFVPEEDEAQALAILAETVVAEDGEDAGDEGQKR